MQKFKKNMKIRRIEVIKPIIQYKTANHIIFGCTGKFGSLVITDTDLELAKFVQDRLTFRKVFRKFNF